MSGMFEDEDPGDARRATQQRPPRSRALLITVGVLVALFLAMTAFSSFWTERLWFESVRSADADGTPGDGYGSVFSKLVVTRVGLFLGFGVLMAVVVAANILIAYRLRPIFRPASPEQVSLDRYRDAVTPIRIWLLLGVSLIVGAFAGAAGSGKWREFLLWRNGVPFEQEDPYFHRDIGFYVFDLPWLHFLVDFAMAATVVSLIAAVAVHYLYGGIRLQSPSDRFSGAAAGQLSLLLGLFVLIKAGDYWLDRFDLLNESGTLITGITYTDDHAVLPAKNILMFIAIICALLFFANVVRRSWLLPSVGLGLFVLSAILLGLIWPGIVQQFQVVPSQADKEEPYIARNIEATRAAYDIAESEVTPYSGVSTLTKDAQREEAANFPGIRLVDPSLISEAFEQQQQLRRYYSVASVLDVDRYIVQGEERDVVLGVREIDQDGIPADTRNWNNLHTVYTHGYGVIAAYGNQRTASGSQLDLEDNGEPIWAGPSDGDTASDLAPEPYRKQIYFGEKSPEYSIVGKPSEDARDVELDQPELEDTDATSTYDGAAGVEVGNVFRKLIYAWKFGEPNIVLSERVHENSKILYDRNPATMVEKVAPWLTVDADPFPAIVGGRVVWILDGYTTTDQYPLSQRGSYQEMTDDALDTGNEFRTLPTDEINYMRNAVKAVVDAYDGTVTLYEWDQDDPMLQAWRNAFPDTVKDREEIPTELLEHFRYPEDLFKVQRYQLAAYHVTNAKDFYEGNARWEVPEDPNQEGFLQPPYRLSVRGADGGSPVFSLTSAFVPFDKSNLAAFVSVDADASRDGYGTIRVLELPASGPVKGPGQIANDFETNADIQEQLLRFNIGNVDKVYGNLLTLPVGESLLYVQPLYTVRSATEGTSGSFPVLNFVLVSFGDQLAIDTTMAGAIAQVLPEAGEPGGGPAPDPGGQPDPGEELPRTAIALLERADEEFAAARASLASGDLAGYEEHTENAEELVGRALEILNEARGGDSGSPSDEETPAAE